MDWSFEGYGGLVFLAVIILLGVLAAMASGR